MIVMPRIQRYEMEFELYPTETRLEAHVRMVITNTTEQSVSEIPLLLYRLFDVQSVTEESGRDLTFSQQVVKFTDLTRQQVNRVQIQLAKPLGVQESVKIALKYGGEFYGSPEVWGYLRERIGEDFSLIRMDTFSYPILTTPSTDCWRVAAQTLFTYDVKITVPAGYVVACRGEQREVCGEERRTVHFQSRVGVQRVDIAVGRYAMLEDGVFRVFYFPEHAEGARRVLEGMRGAFSYFSRAFGELPDFLGYTVIEIPDGFGSQAGASYALQTEPVFQSPQYLPELYHELGHNWNALPEAELAGCRWFDEAFASYFQALAAGALHDPAALTEQMELYRTYFHKWGERDSKCLEIPIAEYAQHGLGHLSYTKGAWSLYVLHRLLGEGVFQRVIATFLVRFRGRTVNFADFRQVAEEASGRNLERYFADWIYGNISSQWLMEGMSVETMVERVSDSRISTPTQ